MLLPRAQGPTPRSAGHERKAVDGQDLVERLEERRAADRAVAAPARQDALCLAGAADIRPAGVARLGAGGRARELVDAALAVADGLVRRLDRAAPIAAGAARATDGRSDGRDGSAEHRRSALDLR